MKTGEKSSLSRPSSELEEDHPLFQPSRFRYLPLAVFLLLLLNLLATCSNSRASRIAAKNQPFIYIQTPNGATIQAQPVDPLYRSDATIAQFAENWLQLAYTWKSIPQKDKAYVEERGTKFPYQFHAASLAIEPGYREAYMDLIAKKYQKEFALEKYISGEQQSYLRFFEQPQIIPVKKGIWDVKIVATRTHAKGDSIFAHEIFNRVIRLRAIKPSSSQFWGNEETHLGKLLNEMQRQGFQIIEINDF